jgi:hypothetical protein
MLNPIGLKNQVKEHRIEIYGAQNAQIFHVVNNILDANICNFLDDYFEEMLRNLSSTAPVCHFKLLGKCTFFVYCWIHVIGKIPLCRLYYCDKNGKYPNQEALKLLSAQIVP